eukprot:4569708-Prorocentrum_lima.AAC.1
MTSSLVGSEMCIRDRRCLGCVEQVVYNVDAPVYAMVLCLQHVVSFSSVSYTHLTLPTICSV